MILFFLQLLSLAVGSWCAVYLVQERKFAQSMFVVLMVFCTFGFLEIQYYTIRFKPLDLELRTSIIQPCEVKMYKWYSCREFAEDNLKCARGLNSND